MPEPGYMQTLKAEFRRLCLKRWNDGWVVVSATSMVCGSSVMVLQAHNGGEIHSVSLPCDNWSCPSCSVRMATEHLGRFAGLLLEQGTVWYSRVEVPGDPDPIQFVKQYRARLRQRRKKVGAEYLTVYRASEHVVYTLSSHPLAVASREAPPIEIEGRVAVSLAAAFLVVPGLQKGAVSASLGWQRKTKQDPRSRRIGFATSEQYMEANQTLGTYPGAPKPAGLSDEEWGDKFMASVARLKEKSAR